jgi:hypothetical protein
MCHDDADKLTVENMLSDPLIRMVMDSDGVTVAEFAAVMATARQASGRAWRRYARRTLQKNGAGLSSMFFRSAR